MWRKKLRGGGETDNSAESTAIVQADTTASPARSAQASPTAGSTALAMRTGDSGAVSSTATAIRPVINYDPNGPDGLTYAPKRKQASVVEMLEYVKGLDIDPLKEADMLWIAEEAFNAPLPPGWSEHQDEQARVYFHDTATGASTWRHPMDDLFREVVDYQRRVQGVGGFWEVEDEIAELEDSIRRDLADWMELFDEHGEKFFYNRRTDESRFDDPRMSVYHRLYARIKMVAKMKERLPLLARALRPEEPTEQELEMKRRQKEEEAKYLRLLIRIQSMARVIIAKKKVRLAMAKAVVQKGPQPLKGKLRLRMEKVGSKGEREIVLSQTTPHRRNKAATRIQARMRGVLARKRFRPLVIHRAYLSRLIIKVQAQIRRNLARRRVAKLRAERRVRAAINIQRVYRGYRDRQYMTRLKTEKIRFNWMLKQVVVIQSGMRMALAKRKVKRIRLFKHNRAALMLQRKAKTYMAQKELFRCQWIDEPVQFVFKPTRYTTTLPWCWQLWSAPWAHGTDDNIPEEEQKAPFTNLFAREGEENLENLVISKLQARARGHLLRKSKGNTNAMVKSILKDVVDSAWKTYSIRLRAATKMQRVARGKKMRDAKILEVAFQAFVQKNIHKVKSIQAQFKSYCMQDHLVESLRNNNRNRASIIIQARWRGILARNHCKKLLEEAMWPVKGWFEYTATGPDVVQAEVRFVHNPDFDDFRYFMEYGTQSELNFNLEDLQREVDFCVDSFLASERAHRPTTPPGGWPPPPARPAPVAEVREEPPQQGRRVPSAKGARVTVAPPPDVEPAASPEQETRPSRGKAGAKGKAKAKGEIVEAEPDKMHDTFGSTYQEQSTFMPSGDLALTEFVSTDTPGVSPAAAKAKSKGKAKTAVRPKASASAPSLHSTDPGTSSRAKASPAPHRQKDEAGGEHLTLPAIMPKAKSRRPSPKPSARESKPLFDSGIASEAHLLLMEAPKKYVDINPDPRPPQQHSPAPPSPSPSRSVAAVAAKQQVAALRGSQSAGAIDTTLPGEPAEGAAPAVKAGTAPAPLKRKTYGGTLIGKTFVRKQVEDVSHLPEKDQQAILAEIEEMRIEKEQELVEKAKFHKERRKKEADAKFNKFKGQMDEAEAEQDERQKKKAKELKKWLKRKEEESKARKARDEELMQQVMEKESEKSEQLKKMEKMRLEERERRLRIAEKQKAKLEAQMMTTKADRMARIKILQNPKHATEQYDAAPTQAAQTMPELQQQSPDDPGAMDSDKIAAQSMPEMEQPMKQPMENQMQELGQQAMPMMPMMPSQQRVVHRHIHHHVHYHEGADAEMDMSGQQGMMPGPGDQAQFVDQERRRQIEMQSEARVRAQLEAAGQAPMGGYGSAASMQRSGSEHFHQHRGLPPGFPGLPRPIDHEAETPTNMRRISSMGAISGVDRTQEAFHRGAAPALMGNVEMDYGGRRRGLPNYGANVDRAFSSYADAGRPRNARPALMGHG